MRLQFRRIDAPESGATVAATAGKLRQQRVNRVADYAFAARRGLVPRLPPSGGEVQTFHRLPCGAEVRMRTDEPFWAPLIGAVLLVSLLASLALVAAGGWEWFSGFLSGQAAGWAQAIFGAIAIVAAYRMGSMQMVADRRRDARQRVQEELHRLHVLTALLGNCGGSLMLYERHWSARNFLFLSDVARETWSTSRKNIAAIDPFMVPGAVLVVYLVQVPLRLDALIAAYDAYAESIGRGDGSLKKSIPALQKELNDTNRLLDAMMDHTSDAARECIASLPGEDQAELLRKQTQMGAHAARALEQFQARSAKE